MGTGGPGGQTLGDIFNHDKATRIPEKGFIYWFLMFQKCLLLFPGSSSMLGFIFPLSLEIN